MEGGYWLALQKTIFKLYPLVFCPFTRGFFNVKSNLKNCHFKTAIVALSEKVDEKWEDWWGAEDERASCHLSQSDQIIVYIRYSLVSDHTLYHMANIVTIRRNLKLYRWCMVYRLKFKNRWQSSQLDYTLWSA